MWRFSVNFTGDTGFYMRTSDNVSLVAQFVANFGQELMTKFSNAMWCIFGEEAEITCVTGAPEICKKLDRIVNEENIHPMRAWMKMTDIMQVRVTCKSVEEIKELFVKKLMPEGDRV
jgi:hypothetical protein